MKKRLIGALCFILTATMLVITVFAHSGRTDSKGGHKDNKNASGLGSYHYHCGGYPAHLHSNGVCPYSKTVTEPTTKAPTTEPTNNKSAEQTTEYSTPQNSMPTPTQPITQPPISTEASKQAINEYYEEFPNVPNFGYIANVEPINVYNLNGVYVYQYDMKKVDSESTREMGKKLAEVGFTEYEQFENGLKIRGNDLLILFRYNSNYLLTFAIGKTKKSDKAIADEISVMVDDEVINFDQPPINKNGYVMVPIKYVVEKMGCSVEWDGETQTVYINSPETPIEKNAKKTENINVYVNNELIVFPDQQPINVNSRVLIPIRYVVEKLGYGIEWYQYSQVVYIYKVE